MGAGVLALHVVELNLAVEAVLSEPVSANREKNRERRYPSTRPAAAMAGRRMAEDATDGSLVNSDTYCVFVRFQ